MTRIDFDQRFAARMDNTEGWTQRQLDVLNDLAFAAVADCDPDDRHLKSLVDFTLERASTHYDVHTA